MERTVSANMDITANPKVRAEYDSLQAQFGGKVMLDLDDYCELFKIARRKASCHVHSHGVPHIMMGRTLYIPTTDLALYLARKKARQDRQIIVTQNTKETIQNRRGFKKKAQDAQLTGAK